MKQISSVKFFYYIVLAIHLFALLFSGFGILPKALSGFRNYHYIIFLLATCLSFAPEFRKHLCAVFIKDEIPNRTYKIILWMIIVFYLMTYIKVALHNYYSFGVNAIDFSILDHMIPNTARGKFMQAPFYEFNHFKIHQYHIMFLIYPFQLLFNTPLFSLILHPIVVWSAIFPLILLCTHFKIKRITKLLICLSFFNFIYTAQILSYNYHLEAFYIPFFLFFFYFAERNNYLGIIIFSLLLNSIKEDAALYVTTSSIAYLIFDKNRKWPHVISILISIIVFTVNMKVIVPLLTDHYNSEVIGSKYGNRIFDIIINIIHSPMSFFKDLFSSKWYKISYYFLFIPLLTPKFLIIASSYIFIHAIGKNLMAQLSLYYSAPYIPMLFLAFVLYLAKDNFRIGILKYKMHISLFSFLLIMLIGGSYIRFKDINPDYSSLTEIKKKISYNEDICIQGSIFPHFNYSHLDKIKIWKKSDCSQYLINPSLNPYPLEKSDIDFLLKNNNFQQKKEGGFILLTKHDDTQKELAMGRPYQFFL